MNTLTHILAFGFGFLFGAMLALKFAINKIDQLLLRMGHDQGEWGEHG